MAAHAQSRCWERITERRLERERQEIERRERETGKWQLGVIDDSEQQKKDDEQCFREAEEIYKPYQGPVWSVYHAMANNTGWHLLWIVPSVLAVPPLLLYGIVWLLVKTLYWLVNGFRKSEVH
jgi:hypothetical protein